MRKAILTILLVLFLAAAAFAGSQQTSSTTANQIITKARYYLNETTADFWADDELLAWINQGTMDIASRTRALETTESVTLVADTAEYTISTDYIDIVTVAYVNASGVSKGLQRSNPQSAGNVQDVGEPVYWYEWAGKVGIFPSLSSVTTETATVYLVERPAAVTATDTVLVPAIYDRALTLYVAAQGLLKEGQYAQSGRLMTEYLAELDRYRTDFVERPKEPTENIRQ